LDQESALAG